MRQVLLPVLWLAATAVAMPAWAQAERTEVRSQREDAGARVRQVERAGGRVLQAEPMQRGGQEVYRLKVLTPEGRVRVISGDTRGREGGGRESEDMTGRRRDFRNDQGSDVARAREGRQDHPEREARRGGGGPARDDGNRDVD